MSLLIVRVYDFLTLLAVAICNRLDSGSEASIAELTLNESVEFRIILDSLHDMCGTDSLLAILRCFSRSELQDLEDEILENCGKVDWRSGTDSL